MILGAAFVAFLRSAWHEQNAASVITFLILESAWKIINDLLSEADSSYGE
jgi:divalent metal cation (Fe/Co/Zn/Cd) transporter